MNIESRKDEDSTNVAILPNTCYRKALSVYRQDKIDKLIKGFESLLTGASDIIIHEYPNWSVYFHNKTEAHSFEYDCVVKRKIYKILIKK